MEYGTVSFEGILFAIAYHNEWWYPNLKLNFVFGGLHSAWYVDRYIKKADSGNT